MGCIQPGILPFIPDGDQFALKAGRLHWLSLLSQKGVGTPCKYGLLYQNVFCNHALSSFDGPQQYGWWYFLSSCRRWVLLNLLKKGKVEPSVAMDSWPSALSREESEEWKRWKTASMASGFPSAIACNSSTGEDKKTCVYFALFSRKVKKWAKSRMILAQNRIGKQVWIL